MSLEAIAAVATLNNVYVLDMHKMTCLFHFTKFKEVMALLTHSHIFVINMGEDAGIFDEDHFHLLAGKIATVPVPFVVGSVSRIAPVVRYGLNVGS